MAIKQKGSTMTVIPFQYLLLSTTNNYSATALSISTLALLFSTSTNPPEIS